jgi:hypothetical protein
VLDGRGEFGAGDRAEVGDPRELLPTALFADRSELQRESEELVDEDGPAALLGGDAFDPAFAGELDEGDGLEDGIWVFAEEGRVRGAAGAPAGAAHALEEGGDGGRRVGLEDAVEVADVDALLESRGADDAGVPAAGESLFGGAARFQGDGAVVHEDVDGPAAHPIGHGFGERARLAEEEALLPGGPARGVARERGQAFVEANGELAFRRDLRRIDDDAFPPGGALEPAKDPAGIADRGGEADPLDVVAARRDDPFEMERRCAPRSVPASAWTSSITTSRRSWKRRCTGARGEISRTSSDSGVVRRISAGSLTKARLARSVTSPCQTKDRNPTISAWWRAALPGC